MELSFEIFESSFFLQQLWPFFWYEQFFCQNVQQKFKKEHYEAKLCTG